MVDVALFPIPNSVTFPWVACPLHVFEPRYRQMVRHCLEEDLFMGVCHTEKVLRAATQPQTTQEALNSNQSTYKPCDVFSAGPVELLEELADGRLLIQVHTEVRLRLREEKQVLPFGIWSCDEMPDEECDESQLQALEQSKAKILHRLIALTHQHEQVQEVLRGEHWQTMPAQKFSFAVAGLVGMDADLAQHLLEMTSAQERLDTVLGLINQIGRH